MPATTISGNGGAERYWRHTRDGSRLVLCRNHRILRQTEPRGRWRTTTLLLDDVGRDRAWRAETTSAMSAAISRTGRLARRRDADP